MGRSGCGITGDAMRGSSLTVLRLRGTAVGAALAATVALSALAAGCEPNESLQIYVDASPMQTRG